ncbi:metal ABC transporter permease [Agrococcus sp. SL85]|uniref:metal ABC transporter permease n=1 Tax=Agrococcus sp. SL85 TaxID=2995141 RepID=UPI00226D30FC|nr:metal ABC transporter permease [Agrococcus sp. SL85]WAC66958.1 metal ABC transporter permease [Agrococcus sp. SL85]
MIDLVGPFALPFLQRPLLLLLVLAVAAATVGVLVNLRRLEFIGDGLTHAVFPGLVIGFVVAGEPGLLPGALVAAVAAAVALTAVARRGTGGETGIAILLTSFFSVGVVIVSTRSDYAGQLQELFFGRLLTITQPQLDASTALVALAVALVAIGWRQQVFRAFDPAGAEAAGVRTLRLDLAANIAVGLFVVAAASSVGVLLVLAVLIVPAAAARAVSGRIGVVVLVALAFAALTAWLGLALAFHLSVGLGVDVAPGATVATLMVAAYLLVLGAAGVARRLGRSRTAAA